jgi:DNA invertase Pin-like site-specific DNA recombinase
VLTLAYCRVSTEEQAEEGWSIEGQTDKLRAYANLHDLGEITVISDPGISGKNMLRPGVQHLLAAVEAGHATHVIVWKLDRLSRSLRDLMELRDTFDKHGVTLHSVCENLDLSSPAGRWFFSMMGGQAEYYREALSENVSMGLDRAVKEGRWPNRPKTGYDLIDGLLVPNVDAALVIECFRLRGERLAYREIEERTGIKYSTVKSILDSRIYRGEVTRKKKWYPGVHEPLVSEEEWQNAHRGAAKGVRQSSDPLSGRVICGLCNRKMVVAQNGKGHLTYKCHHRGKGCAQPARSNLGLARAAVVGLRLVGHDEGLRKAIRRRLAGGGTDAAGTPRRTPRAAPAKTLKVLTDQRDKLLGLYYTEKISADGFYEEEARIATAIAVVRQQLALEGQEEQLKTDLEVRFEEVARILSDLDMDAVWTEADNRERRIFVENLVEAIKVFPDHLEVKVVGSPSINVLLSEVGLKVPENVGVGGPTRTRT